MSIETFNDNLLIALETLWNKFLAYVPSLVSAFVILAAGTLLSKFFQYLVVAFLRLLRFERISEKSGVEDGLKRVGLKHSATELFGIVIFWAVLLVFVISAAETLDVQFLTQIIDSVIFYFPNLIGAALFFVFGLMIAHVVRNMVSRLSERMGEDYAHILANVIYALVVVLATVLSIGQLKIEVGLLYRIVEIVFAALGLAFALAAGFGGKELMHNILAGFYLREVIPRGKHVSAEGIPMGVVEKVGAIATKINLDDGGVMYVPNSKLSSSLIRQRA